MFNKRKATALCFALCTMLTTIACGNNAGNTSGSTAGNSDSTISTASEITDSQTDEQTADADRDPQGDIMMSVWETPSTPSGIEVEVLPEDLTQVEEIEQRGELRVGTTGDYKPMSFLDPETGRYEGFDAALAEDLAASLGVRLTYVPTTWPTLMEDTQAGKFDLAICGITITDERKEKALMSDGYMGNGKTLLCRKEDADKYTNLESINRPEVRVMENPGGLNEKFARENLPNATLIIHDTNAEIPGLIASGEADVMITEIQEAGYYVAQDERLAAPQIRRPFTHGKLGVLLPQGSEELLDYVNEFIAEEKDTGRIEELANQYIYQNLYELGEGGPEEMKPAA